MFGDPPQGYLWPDGFYHADPPPAPYYQQPAFWADLFANAARNPAPQPVAAVQSETPWWVVLGGLAFAVFAVRAMR